MVYRKLGKTGLSISEIGLGCGGFENRDDAFMKELFQIAFENGVNCMDLFSSNPQLRSAVGRVLRGRRDGFIIQAHIGSVWRDGQYKRSRDLLETKEAFEDLLTRLETPYIDIGMIHYVDSPDDWQKIVDGGIMPYVQELKASGKIRHIGLSSHNPQVALEAVNSGLIEVLMFSVNPCYDLLPANEDVESLWADASYDKPLFNMDVDRQLLYEACERNGVGITVMKAFGGGDLLTTDSPAGRALTVNQCIHYALTRPAVSTVFTGVRSEEELHKSLVYETASYEEKDYAAAFASFPKMSWKGYCMYCGHCAPCHAGIEVASVTKLLRLVEAQGFVPETEREHYALLAHHAGECAKCGACENRCPFGVDVRGNMNRAAEIFGK